VSTIVLCKRLNQIGLIEERKDKEISVAKVEISRLTAELAEMENLKKRQKD